MSKKLDVQKINSILENLCSYELGRKFKKVYESESKNFYDEKSQGEEGERVLVFDVGEDLFLKVIETSNSYGEELGIKTVKFVQQFEKTIKVYE